MPLIHHSKRLQLERSCFLKANRGVGNNGVVMAKNNTKHWCKCFGRYSPQELKAIYLSKHEPSTSSYSYLSKHEPSTSSGWLYTCTTSEWTLRNLRNSLDCDGHATLFPDWNPWFKETPTRSVGTIYLCSQRTTPNIGANVWANFPKNCENNIHQTT